MMRGRKTSDLRSLFAALACVAAVSACGKKPEYSVVGSPSTALGLGQAWPVVTRPRAIGPRMALQGKLYIHDGDTIYTGKGKGRKAYRFWGIDALELAQKCRHGAYDVNCGVESRRALVALVAHQPVACEKMGEDRRKDARGKLVIREVAICYSGQTELNAQLVRQGWALDEGKFSRGYYAPLQREAESRKSGIWKYDAFQKPAEYRQARYKANARKAKTP